MHPVGHVRRQEGLDVGDVRVQAERIVPGRSQLIGHHHDRGQSVVLGGEVVEPLGDLPVEHPVLRGAGLSGQQHDHREQRPGVGLVGRRQVDVPVTGLEAGPGPREGDGGDRPLRRKVRRRLPDVLQDLAGRPADGGGGLARGQFLRLREPAREHHPTGRELVEAPVHLGGGHQQHQGPGADRQQLEAQRRAAQPEAHQGEAEQGDGDPPGDITGGPFGEGVPPVVDRGVEQQAEPRRRDQGRGQSAAPPPAGAGVAGEEQQ